MSRRIVNTRGGSIYLTENERYFDRICQEGKDHPRANNPYLPGSIENRIFRQGQEIQKREQWEVEDYEQNFWGTPRRG